MTNNDVIKTAFKVWGREFYQTTSLSSLAKALGVSKTALYRHFKDKNALLIAMNDHFIDEYTAFIMEDYKKALECPDLKKRCYIMIRVMCEYYGRNPDSFIYAMFQIIHKWPMEDISGQMMSRGIDFSALSRVNCKPDKSEKAVQNAEQLLLLIQFTMISMNFRVAEFHHCDRKGNLTDIPVATEEEIQILVDDVEKHLRYGLGINMTNTENLDFLKLEKMINVKSFNDLSPAGTDTADEKLFKAVSESVAEAGPWNTSMEMVARRLGFAKSSLYAHFRDKQDMLGKLFFLEASRIIKCSNILSGLSAVPEEQLYLAMCYLAEYLRSRHDILIALNWIRTRLPEPGPDLINEMRLILPEIYRIITDIDMPVIKEAGDKKNPIARWIYFSVMNVLLRQPDSINGVNYKNFRLLYKYICGGLEGFNI